MDESSAGERPGYDGFGRRTFRQSVLLRLGAEWRRAPDVVRGEIDYVAGDLYLKPGTESLRILESVRHDRLALDGVIERSWVLKVEAM